ncbi:MAG TPA: DUF1343 domain-containing protein, partial [Sediminispirochaeta sp.]|nr:DUF1343 domain-containing protein [Sediminispirochaeta sp.]
MEKMVRTILGIEKLMDSWSGQWSSLALLSNMASILPDGRPVWRALRERGLPLVRIFGPEHGFLSEIQDAIPVEDDVLLDMEMVSLYGSRKEPEEQHMSDLDAVIIDIQDVGSRYYTYLYTAAAVMANCADYGVEALVCDRPNPINAETIEGGPIADEHQNEVGAYGLPPRHGLTIGEFAKYFKHEYRRDLRLTVFWMSRYGRRMYYGDTKLPWKQPSPNLPTPKTALVYPGTCLFEGTNLSEGRGTT